MNIKIVISGKIYDMSYEKKENTYSVNPNHSDFNGTIPSPFIFQIIDGRARFLIVSQKGREVAFEIVNQIAIFEGRL